MIAPTVDFLYSEEESSLRDSLRKALALSCPAKRINDLYDGDYAAERDAWHTLVEFGLVGLLIDEELGGSAGTPTDAAVVLEELGYAAAPTAFLESSVIATSILKSVGDHGVLRRLAAGDVAVLLTSASCAAFSKSRSFEIVGSHLYGSVPTVAGAAVADILIVPVASNDGVSLHLVESNTDGVTINRIPALDMTRALADVSLKGATGTCIGLDCDGAINDALTLGAALATSDQLGGSQWCLDQLLSYLRTRYQFGRSIGSFQAIKHRMADIWLEVELMRTAARTAAATATSDELPVYAAVAQSFSSDAAVHVAEETIQLHAGLAMTWEYPAHLYLKRAKTSQVFFGNASVHREKLGSLIDLSPPT